MKFAFIAKHQARFPTAWMCRRLGVSTSGYYASWVRAVSPRKQRDVAIRQRLRYFHTRSNGVYGRPRLVCDLAADGIRTSAKRGARLLRIEGLQRALILLAQ